jgi:hypothetical protein
MPSRRLRKRIVIVFAAALLAAIARAGEPEKPAVVRELVLVHFSHTDFGFTDHPAVCREMQVRYLDLAIDAVNAMMKAPEDTFFSWTAETTDPVRDWWRAASPERRKDLLAAVGTGRLEIAALPFNNTPFLDALQWDLMLRWLPAELWEKVRPRVAIQNDVNGIPRAGAIRLLDRGVRRIFSGINSDSGGPPFGRPSAFRWKMPDGRTLLVYLNLSYPVGFDLFEDEWRRGPVPRAADARYRPPRAGDVLRTDEASLRKAHRRLLGVVRGFEAGGYSCPVLVLSITNQWRIDNDPPLLSLVGFVHAWNALGLEPRLRLATASKALDLFEEAAGDRIPVHEGEWTDWWANGTASAPREVAASRLAKRLLGAALSPVLGIADDRLRSVSDDILRDLCLFDEHTWGSSSSVALPWSLDSQGQFAEKANLAYRSMARAEWLLGQRLRLRLAGAGEGLHIANPTRLPWSGWIRMPATCLRGQVRSVEDLKTGLAVSLRFDRGLRPFTRPAEGELSPEDGAAATFPDQAPGQVARFWARVDGGSIRTFRLSEKDAGADISDGPAQDVSRDASGWPASATWKGMGRPLFTQGFGDIVFLRVKGYAPRWIARDIRETADAAARERMRKEKLEEALAEEAGPATMEEDAHTVTWTQRIRHPRLRWATRRLELWKGEPHARLTMRFYRISSDDPEIIHIAVPVPCPGVLPRLSSGGEPFTPFRDQLPGSCRDHFAIDGWAQYETDGGSWIVASRDAPLVTLGSPAALSLRRDPPPDPERLLVVAFDNFWYTNFAGDSHGAMEFQLDIAWREKVEGPRGAADVAEALVLEPPQAIEPARPEDPAVIERLWRP